MCRNLVCLVLSLVASLLLVSAGSANSQGRDVFSPYPPADYLLISNSPETVRERGVLFQERLEGKARYRLFIHHLNQTDAEHLTLSLRATDTTGGVGAPAGSAAYLTVAGLAISPYPFSSGWQALQAYSGSGDTTLAAQLQPGIEQDVWSVPLPPGQVLTAYVLIETEEDTQLQLRLGDGDRVLAPDGIHHRAVIADPSAQRELQFSLRDRLLEIPFGASGAFRDRNTGQVLRGEYGIDYRLTLTVHNPFDVAMPLHLLFIPRGSDGRLLIHVDGQPYLTGHTFSGHYSLVHRWTLHPGQTRTFSLWTTPVSAMGYPAILRFSTYLDPGWPRHPTPAGS